MENPVTKRFGRYEIIGELGRGAMGVVYKARDPQIDRLVALKTISLRGQEQSEEDEFRQRFKNEAQAAGRLQHVGIVGVFDVGEDPQTRDPYIVLEYVAGEALNRMLAREKKLPLTKALQLTQEVAEALDCAHAQGVVHRDIKPGNILVTEDCHAKIADFGIAKLNLAHFTVPGKVLGTPAYMAPEQLCGQGVDGRSDLFSLGVILYVMVTGHSPFQGDSATTVCFKVANREPLAPSALDLNLPAELDAVIARAMAKDPEQRYQRGTEFAGDVRDLQQMLNPTPTTTSRRLATSTGTRPDTAGLGKISLAGKHPTAGLTPAARLVRTAMQNAPLQNSILGIAALAMLLVIAIPSRLLESPPRAGRNTSSAAVATQSSGAAQAPTLSNASAPAPRKNRASDAGAKQVIVPMSTLELAVQHQFKVATLDVWVDDQLALTRSLHGGAQKRLVVFNGIRGVESETLQVPAGKHVLRLRAVAADQTVDLSRTISADFIGGSDKTLQVSFEKHNTVMRLSWQ